MGQGAALALTLAVELLVAFGWLRRTRPSLPPPRIVIAGLLPSLLTHPLAWRAAAALPAAGYARGVLAIEAAVVLVEAVVLRLLLGRPWQDALLLALLANAASFAVGALLFA